MGERGRERTVLGSTPVCYRRNLRSFREGEGRGGGRPTSEGRRRTGHGCKPRVLSFFVPSLPFPPREISNVPSPPPPTVKKFRSAINASPNKERESGRKMARALLLPPSSRDHPTDPRWMIFFSFFQNILFTRKFLFRLFSSCYADKEERSWIFLWIVRKRGMARSFRIFFSFQDISKYIFRFVFFFFFFLRMYHCNLYFVSFVSGVWRTKLPFF